MSIYSQIDKLSNVVTKYLHKKLPLSFQHYVRDAGGIRYLNDFAALTAGMHIIIIICILFWLLLLVLVVIIAITVVILLLRWSLMIRITTDKLINIRNLIDVFIWYYNYLSINNHIDCLISLLWLLSILLSYQSIISYISINLSTIYHDILSSAHLCRYCIQSAKSFKYQKVRTAIKDCTYIPLHQ